MKVELVALGALDHPQAVVARVREHAALLPLNLSHVTMKRVTLICHINHYLRNTLLTAWPSSGTE